MTAILYGNLRVEIIGDIGARVQPGLGYVVVQAGQE
jgi:hypothetical protein